MLMPQQTQKILRVECSNRQCPYLPPNYVPEPNLSFCESHHCNDTVWVES